MKMELQCKDRERNLVLRNIVELLHQALPEAQCTAGLRITRAISFPLLLRTLVVGFSVSGNYNLERFLTKVGMGGAKAGSGGGVFCSHSLGI